MIYDQGRAAKVAVVTRVGQAVFMRAGGHDRVGKSVRPDMCAGKGSIELAGPASSTEVTDSDIRKNFEFEIVWNVR